MATPAVAALAGLPAGASLLSAIADLDLSSLRGFDLPLVLRAVYRLGNHTRALLLDVVAETMRRKDPDGTWAGDWDEVAVHEVRAALTMSRTAANSLNHLAQDLSERLPQVLAAMRSGVLDQPRARVFSSWTAWLSEAHARAVVDALLPVAPTLTTGELIDEIRRVAIELDPDFARRQHDHGRSQRQVRGAISHDGTGHITAEGLSAAQVAAACDRLDAIGWQLKRAGHPDKLDHIRTDVFAGLLTGQYAGLTDQQLLEKLLVNMPATPTPGPSSTSDPQSAPDGAEPGSAGNGDEPDPGGRRGDTEPDVDRAPDMDLPGEDKADEDDFGEPAGAADRRDGAAQEPADDEVAGAQRPEADNGPDTENDDRDRRPCELLGSGLLHAEIAREVAAAPTAAWWYVLTDRRGRPLYAGPVRRRPTRPWCDGEPFDVDGVEVWLQLTSAELAALVAHPPPGWERIVDGIRHRVTHSPAGAPDGDPTGRFPSPGLRRYLAMRDRRCTFPTCRIPSHRCQIDHTIDHAHGGPTIESNLANVCAGDHALKTNHGWRARQLTAGHLVWTSPMGHEYERRPPRGPSQAQPPMADPAGPEHDWFREVTDDELDGWFGVRPTHTRTEFIDKWWLDRTLHYDGRPDPNAPRPEPEPKPEPKLKPAPPERRPADDIIPF